MSDKRIYKGREREIDAETLEKAWLKGELWAIELERELQAEQKWELIKALIAAAPDEDTLRGVA